MILCSVQFSQKTQLLTCKSLGVTGLLIAHGLKQVRLLQHGSPRAEVSCLHANRAYDGQAGIEFSIFESEPSAATYRPREWGMAVHWALPQLDALLPPDLRPRLKETFNDPFTEVPERDEMMMFDGVTGKLLISIPISKTIRVSRRKLRAFCTQGIDVKVCRMRRHYQNIANDKDSTATVLQA